jgi:hypothetical protein
MNLALMCYFDVRDARVEAMIDYLMAWPAQPLEYVAGLAGLAMVE